MSRRRIADRFRYEGSNSGLGNEEKTDWGLFEIEIEPNPKGGRFVSTAYKTCCPLALDAFSDMSKVLITSATDALSQLPEQTTEDLADCFIAALHAHAMQMELLIRLATVLASDRPVKKQILSQGTLFDLKSQYDLPQTGFLNIAIKCDDRYFTQRVYFADPVKILLAALGRPVDAYTLSLSVN